MKLIGSVIIYIVTAFFINTVLANNEVSEIKEGEEFTARTYLANVAQLMKNFYDQYQRYANSMEELILWAPALNNEAIFSKGKYRYKIAEGNEKYFKAISINDYGFRNYEVDSEFYYIRWIFDSKEERDNLKSDYLKKFEASKDFLEKSRIAYDLGNFADKDTKLYLANILLKNDEMDMVKQNASASLRFMCDRSDQYLIPFFIKVIKSNSADYCVKCNIVRMFKIFKSYETIDILKKIVKEEKDTLTYSLKTESSSLIEDILKAKEN